MTIKTGYLAKHLNKEEIAFLPPVSYSIAMNLHRFEDRYGEKPDGCVWRPNCPTNHVALGTVYTKTCTIPARVFHKLRLKIYRKNPAIIFAAEFKMLSKFKFVISEIELHFGNVLQKLTFFS